MHKIFKPLVQINGNKRPADFQRKRNFISLSAEHNTNYLIHKII